MWCSQLLCLSDPHFQFLGFFILQLRPKPSILVDSHAHDRRANMCASRRRDTVSQDGSYQKSETGVRGLIIRVPRLGTGPDWFSFWSHALGFFGALVGTVLLLLKSSSTAALVSSVVYGGCTCVLFFASSLHHAVSFNRNQDDLLKVQNVLRRFDHISIYLMIAGSYTPLCTCALDQSNARPLLIFVWALALAGVIQKVCLAFSPRWSTVATYLFMGWVSVSMWNPLNRLYAMKDLMWLIMGGVLYSIGAVIYASKIPDFAPDIVGFHGLWHVFVLLAAFCHFYFNYQFVIA